MYDELVKRLHKRIVLTTAGSSLQDDLDEAADAMEELQKRVDESIPKDDAEIIIAEVAKPRWIPVTERLPEEKECVLVLGGYFAKVMETAILDDGLFYSAWDNRTEMFGVTHWMPLPEPPKEET